MGYVIHVIYMTDNSGARNVFDTVQFCLGNVDLPQLPVVPSQLQFFFPRISTGGPSMVILNAIQSKYMDLGMPGINRRAV